MQLLLMKSYIKMFVGTHYLWLLNLNSVPCLTWRQSVDHSRQKAVCIFWIVYMQLVTAEH